MFVHDPADATVATKISWQAIKGFDRFLFACALVSGTGLLTVKVFAATASDGTGATEVKAHSDPTVADAAGDVVYIEVSAEQIKEVLAGATHVSLEVDCDANTDIAAVTYTFLPRRRYAGQTADQIA
jgi:hypothetical protein